MRLARYLLGILIGGVAFGLWAEVLGLGGKASSGGFGVAVTAAVLSVVALSVFVWDDRVRKRERQRDRV